MLMPRKRRNGTKNVWVSFYNEEVEELLHDFNFTKRFKRWVPIKTDEFRRIWVEGYEKTGVKITPKILRDWFCVAMGEAGVPDRYVDAFCGRLPRSVLARHYTDYSPMRLKRIYDKAGLKVLG